jgi:peptide subunit release factor 1 (eRF1)
MGDVYTYKCRTCGYTEDFNQGHGYLVHPQSVHDYLALKKKLFHYKTHNKIVALSKMHNNLQMKATFQVYLCHTCQILYNKAEVIVYEEDKIYHRSRFRCSACNSRLKLTNIHRLKQARCPVCKSLTFKRDSSPHHLWH